MNVVTKYSTSIGDRVNLEHNVRLNINIVPNLNITDTHINKIKCLATRSFLKAYKKGEVRATGLIPFLQDTVGIGKLTRAVSSSIAKEILVSYDEVVAGFEQENVVQSEFCDELNRLVIDGMNLK